MPPPRHIDSSEGEDWDQMPWEVGLSSQTASRLFSTCYPTVEAIQDDLKAFCIENHMGLVTRSSQKNKAKTQVVKFILSCDKDRRNLQPSIAKTYNTSTTKTSSHCPFRVILQALVSNAGQWTARLEDGHHKGHGPSDTLQEHRSLRNLTEDQQLFVTKLYEDRTITTRSIFKQLQQKWPDTAFRL